MRTFNDAKAIAKSLRQALKQKNIEISHSEGLELVAAGFRFRQLERACREDRE